MANRKIVYVDMDRTLCDYSSAFFEFKKKGYNWPQSQYGFFLNLTPIEDALDSYKKLEEIYDVYILTKPSYMNPMSYTEKRVWVERHLGIETCKKLILSPNKALLLGDYLIDDMVHEGFVGEHIHFGTEKFPNWKTVFNYLTNK